MGGILRYIFFINMYHTLKFFFYLYFSFLFLFYFFRFIHFTLRNTYLVEENNHALYDLIFFFSQKEQNNKQKQNNKSTTNYNLYLELYVRKHVYHVFALSCTRPHGRVRSISRVHDRL